MSQFKESLDTQISALKKKQRELELISTVVDFVAHLADEEKQDKEVADKVKDLFTAFANRAIQVAQNGPRVSQEKTPVSAVSAVPKGVEDTTPQNLPPAPPTGDVQSKIKFAMAYRHLGEARVKVGDTEGIVVGIDAPNILVKTDENQLLKTTPEKLTVIQVRKAK